MGFSALQIILVFVWVFIVAIDQFDFLESLYQPAERRFSTGYRRKRYRKPDRDDLKRSNDAPLYL